MDRTWMIWLALFIGALVLEGITMQLFSVWFAVGALAGIIASVAGAQAWVQIVLFVAVSAVSLAATRPLVKRMQNKKPTPTNADRFVGQNAEVLEEIDNIKGTGVIKVLGQTWSARTPVDGVVIPEGETVVTLSIQGAKLLVELPIAGAAASDAE